MDFITKCGEWLAGVHPFVVSIIFFGVCIVLYKTVFKFYKDFLLRKYEFNIMSWPVHVTMASYFLAITLPTITGVGFDPVSASATGGGWVQLMILLAIGLPGMICFSVQCFRQTDSIIVTAINLPLMYFICFIMGYLYAFFLLAIIVGTMLKSVSLGKFIGGRSGPGPGPGAASAYTCPHCGGSMIAKGITCSCGRSYNAWGYDYPRETDNFPRQAGYTEIGGEDDE